MLGKSAIFVLVLSLALCACQSTKDDAELMSGTTSTTSTPISSPTHGGPLSPVSHTMHPTSAGILLEAWAGNDVITSLDSADNLKDQQAEIRAETGPIGQKITWSNPDSGHSGTILPIRDGYSNSGVYCRDFQQSIAINGQQHQGADKACQQPDGSWKIAL